LSGNWTLAEDSKKSLLLKSIGKNLKSKRLKKSLKDCEEVARNTLITRSNPHNRTMRTD